MRPARLSGPRNPKAHLFRPSRIAEAFKLAMECGAVDLAMGSPDFPAPETVKAAAVEAIRADVNQYGNGWGSLEVRRAIARHCGTQYGVAVDPATEITVTCGATEGVFLALTVALEPGDEVILFEPFYEGYVGAALLIGARVRFVRLHQPDWQLDLDELTSAITPRTRAIVVNSPNNPTGKVFTAAELQDIARVCLEHDLLCITDEIYEHVLFDGRRHRSMLQVPEMRERTIAVSAASKTYLVTGWRIGWAIAPAAFTDVLRKTHELVTVAAPAPFQQAAVAGLNAPESYYVELAAANQARRDYLVSVLTAVGFDCLLAQGGFFVMAAYSRLTDMADEAFADFLIREIGVATVPGSVFFSEPAADNHLLRLCFSKARRTLEQAAERLQALPATLRACHESIR